MHLELLELQRRVHARVPLPSLDLGAEAFARHEAHGAPLLQFEHIPLELSDLRLMVRQTVDILRRHGAIEQADAERLQSAGRDLTLLALAGGWFRSAADRTATGRTTPPGGDEAAGDDVLDQVFTLAMRPFLGRCAELVQQREGLGLWTHPYCPACGGDPDFAVVTPAAERHLLCGRCSLQWKFEALTCPFCRNADRSRMTTFATQDGLYRVYACNACHRYLKAYDSRYAARPVLHDVDTLATLPLDAAAIQRGYA